MNRHRRSWLKATLAVALADIVLGALAPLRRALAADWPRDAYAAKTVPDALKNLYGTSEMSASAEVKIRAPLQAENGAVVPVAVSSALADVQAISILVEKNAAPLVAHISLAPGTLPYFSANIKMASTSDVIFVVKSGNKLYGAKQNIKVTVGGCGG